MSSYSRNNRLINEKSPYLRQHAHNPVDWYPWGEEALESARVQDKPILLSIGYSACHWCHVMAHESFENEDIARLMNDNFINIKVDREERPDLDTIYMEAVQSLTGGGGWPLTVFLLPDTKPFYGGTYYPPEDRHGRPGFARVLRTVADAYRYRRKQVEEATEQIMAALNKEEGYSTDQGELTIDILSNVCLSLKRDFDRINGGFGRAPKFPQPLVLEFLLRYYYRMRDEDTLNMVTRTLEKMAGGGIYDQLGGGFHRYSTDDRWLVPHFEKMLYDNALLSSIYLHAYLVTRKPLFRRICEETIDSILREMTGKEGAFYSSQDADSEGVEGKYYLWTSSEIKEVLGENAGSKVNIFYGVTSGGNFEGRNILHVPEHPQKVEPEINREMKELLRKKREQRVHPARDEKTLASWNGLALASLAEAAIVLNRQDYLVAATANASFLLNSMTSGGYLQHVYNAGRAGVEGYLEDYAMVIKGLLELHRATCSGEWLRQAINLAELMINLFWNEAEGAFYDTSIRHQALFVRPKNVQDGALPSGASEATMVLIKIARLTGNERLEKIAGRSLQSIYPWISRYPQGFGNWLCALDFYLSDPREIVLVGPRDSPATQELLHILADSWLPATVMAIFDPNNPSSMPALKLLGQKYMLDNQPTVFLCENYSCKAPMNDPDLLRRHLLNEP